MVNLGRWALSFFCGITSYYDLPWIIGIVSSFFIALTAVVIVALFKIRHKAAILCTCGILAAAPATTETFFFLYTADGYMIAMFLAALSTYLSRMGQKDTQCWILSAICLCLSCATYQAYVSFALVLMICEIILALFRNQIQKDEFKTWLLKSFLVYLSALAVYAIVWFVLLHFTDAAASSYQGISEVGTLSFGLITHGIIGSIQDTIRYFLQSNVLKNGWTVYAFFNVLFLLSAVFAFYQAYSKSPMRKKKSGLLLLILCILLIVPAACLWNFTSTALSYRPMMLHSYSLLYILVFVLYEEWGNGISKIIESALMLAIVFNNALMANISYFYLDLSSQRSYADGIEIMSEIHSFQDENAVEKIAFIGDRRLTEEFDFDVITGKHNADNEIKIFKDSIETSLIYNHDHAIRYLHSILGLNIPSCTNAELAELEQNDAVKSMKPWPHKDSFQMIGNTLVIKLAD